MQGIIQAVQTSPGGDFPLEAAAPGATVLSFGDASDFDPIGGELEIDGVVLGYVSADLEEDVVTLAEPLAFALETDIFVATVPATQSAHATVALGDDIVLAEIPHHLKPMLPEGLREPGAGEAVVIEEVAAGAWRVADVAGSRPAFDGSAIFDIDKALLENKRILGEKLAENDQAILDAQGELSIAQGRIDDAFSEIDLKTDTAYVDAAKQQAIDAAAVDAQTKADAAEAEALAKIESLSAGLDNKVRNPGFENGMTSWDNADAWVTDGTQAHSGGASARIDGPSSVGLSSPVEIPVRPGQTWRWTSWVMTSTDFSGNLGMRPIRRGSNVANVPGHVNVPAAVVEGWQKLVMDYTVLEGDTHLQAMRFANQIDTGTVWIDDVSFTDVTEVVALEADLQQAIASGDAAAIADAEAKIATAKAEAIDAAADDAAAKASAAQAAAVQTSQDALDQAELDLQNAIASGDAAAIAEAEAAIAVAKQEAIDAAAADATAKAAEAMQKANDALTAAQSAQATADNAIRTYYLSDPPWANNTTQPDEVLGDMWFDLDDGQAYRWNGTTWQVIQDGSIAEALAAAQNAQTTADGKITAFYQANQPLEADEGDLWFDTDSDSRLYRRVGGNWTPLLDAKALADAAEQAAKTAAAADATAKAEAAEAAAVAAAAADAQTKADAAEAAAEAAAALHADLVASNAEQAAIDAAALDAQTKSDAAQQAAIDAAALDATAKAEAAEAAAAATAAADATAKADAAQAAAVAAAEQVESRALSRGTDLVTNGTGFLGNNYNFSGFTFDASDAPTGALGSFVTPLGSNTSRFSDELMPIDLNKTYRLTIAAKQKGVFGGRLYTGLQTRDAFGYGIGPTNYAYQPGTTTALTRELKPGDTTVEVESTAGWYTGTTTHMRSIIVWNYTDPAGKTWPTETYSRLWSGSDAYSGSGLTSTVITLRQPWPANLGTHPVGTEISNGRSGGSYQYDPWVNDQVPTEWSSQAADFGGLHDGSTGAATTRFPPGTATAQLVFLPNRASGGGGAAQPDSQIAVAALSFSDASAAQARAEQAETNAKAYTVERTDGISRSYQSTSLPGTTMAPQDSVWYVRDGAKIAAVFMQVDAGVSSNWVARPITSEAIDNLDVGKLTALEGTINDLVATEFAARLANIIQANIGNLTVTGDAHLNDAVAERIMADTARFLTVYADQVDANAIDGMVIRGVHMLASTLTLGEGMELTEDFGLRQFGPDGALNVSIPSDGSEVTFRGDVSARTFAATGRMSIQSDGAVASGGMLELESGVVPPVAPPTVSPYVERTPFPPLAPDEEAQGLAWAGGSWWRAVNVVGAAQGDRIERIDTTGALLSSFPSDGDPRGMTAIGDELFVLATDWSTSANDRRVFVYDLTGNILRSWPYTEFGTGTFQPGIGTNGTDILIAQPWADGRLTWRRYNKTTGAYLDRVDSPMVEKKDIRFIGQGSFDYGVNRVVVGWGDQVGTTSLLEPDGDYLPLSGWFAANRQEVQGTVWANGRFHHLTLNGDLVTSSTVAYPNGGPDNETDDWWAALTWSDGTSETPIGPARRFKFRRRTDLLLSFGIPPEGVTLARVHLGRGTTEPSRTSMRYIAEFDASAGQAIVVLPSDWETRANPPSTNTFPSSTPGLIRSGLGNFQVDGTGAGQWGPLTFHPDGTMSSSAVPDWVPITAFASGFGPESWGYVPAYRLWPDGKVEWRGVVAGSVTGTSLPFVIPAEARPTQPVNLPAVISYTGGSALVTRIEFGAVASPTQLRVYRGDADYSWLSLDGATYYVS